MTDIRQKQNLEILDVFKNVQRQVMDRQNKQIAVMPQTNAPKQQRDLDSEINSDKTVEQLNKVLETKLGALEGLVQVLPEKRSVYIKSQSAFANFAKFFTEATNIGDVLVLWNQIARYFSVQGLARESQEAIKVGLQQLTPNVEAMKYGLKKSSSAMIANGEQSFVPYIMNAMRSLSVYDIISAQLNAGECTIISNDELQSEYKNTFQSLTQNEIDWLKYYAPRGTLSGNIRNIPDFDRQDAKGRLRQIENELGIKLPAQYTAQLRNYPRDQLALELDKIRQKNLPADKFDTSWLNDYSLLAQASLDVDEELQTLAQQQVHIKDEIEELQKPERVHVPNMLPQMAKPVKPPQVRERDYPERAEYLLMVEERNRRKKDYLYQLQEWTKIKDHNAFEQEKAEANSPEKIAELIQAKEEELQAIQPEWDILMLQQQDIIRQKQELEDRTSDNVFKNLLKDLPVKVNKNIEDFIDARGYMGMGKSKGRSVDTRGLASMRENYGAHSESDSESDEGDSDEGGALDFDDSRNDHYYTKPIGYR